MRAGRLQYIEAAVERHPIARHQLIDLGVCHLFAMPGRQRQPSERIELGGQRGLRSHATISHAPRLFTFVQTAKQIIRKRRFDPTLSWPEG